VLFTYFKAKVGREDIFKPTIRNETLHETSKDIGIRVVKFAISNNQIVNSTMFPHHIIHKYTRTSCDGKMHNQIEHILTHTRCHSSVADVRSFSGNDYDTDHYLVVAEVRERERERERETVSK